MSTTNVSLYDILEAEEALQNIENADTYTEALEVQKEEKINNTVKYIQQLETWARGAKDEATRLTLNAKVLEYRAQKIRDWIAYSLKAHDVKRVETSLARISFRQSTQVVIDNEASVPDEYKQEKTTISIDKVSIKEAIKNGLTVTGARIVTNDNLQIK